MLMQVYAALYHAFMPLLYAGTLYQGLYQVYATRAPLGFTPGRRGDRRLTRVGSMRKSGRPRRWGHFGQIPSVRDVLSHEISSSRLLYDGLCRGIILLYVGAM